MARSSMSSLIAKLQGLCNDDATFSADNYQAMLDSQSQPFDVVCVPLDSPTFTRFTINTPYIETTAQVYVTGSRTVLTETTQYTLDYNRGILTTPSTSLISLSIRGMTYNVYAAASDAWERIASRYALEFDFSDVEGSYRRSQQYDMCLKQATRYKGMAGARSTFVERGDMPGGWPMNIDRIATG